jgi:hypothetical protein
MEAWLLPWFFDGLTLIFRAARNMVGQLTQFPVLSSNNSHIGLWTKRKIG